MYDDPGNTSDHIVQAFNMLDIDCGIYVNSRIQQLLNILIALFIAEALRIGMGKLINDNDFWFFSSALSRSKSLRVIPL